MTSILERAEKLAADVKEHLWPNSPPWVGFQGWRDLLFASWSMQIDEVRAVVPSQLELDSYDGRAWVSLVPMRVEGAHFRDLSLIPGLENCDVIWTDRASDPRQITAQLRTHGELSGILT
jgi:hypothetical protein